MDQLVKALGDNGNIRAYCAITTNICEKAREIHNCLPTSTAALGRTLTAGVLMAGMFKEEYHRLTLQIKGDGPIGSIIVDANGKGFVRGTISNPHVHMPLNPLGKLDVGNAVGKNGFVRVIKDLGLKEPYIGQTELISGEIGEDITNYFALSEQIPSAVALGVLVDTDNTVSAAGGFIIQLMPEASDETIDILEKNIQSISSVSHTFKDGVSPTEMLQDVLKGIELEVLETKNIEYKCDCNRDRLKAVLHSLRKEEIEDILKNPGFAEITCHFCNTQYMFSKEDLEKILER